ncbi:hypothetical protein RM407_001519 [Enterobacter kobei]|nr:hypothetical protein [Enterobacter kobei]
MAYVTNIKSIANNTVYPLTIIDGENGVRIAIAGSGAWNGDLWVPWIGNQSEDYKAIKIIWGFDSEQVIYLYQDYWYPPHENAVKYRTISPLVYYDGNNHIIPGNGTGGGNKGLILTGKGKDIELKMV